MCKSKAPRPEKILFRMRARRPRLNCQEWIQVGEGNEPVSKGLLAKWDTDRLEWVICGAVAGNKK